MEQGNSVLALNPLSLELPVELLREIILLYLADCILDLIAEPSIEKIWDPLSSPLHTSTLFREVTAGLLENIFGEVSSREPGESSILNYRYVLAKLKQIHAFAYTDDPKLLLDSDSAISSILSPRDLKSRLIPMALEFAIAKTYNRLCEPSSGITMAEVGQTFLTHFESQSMQPSGGVTASVAWRVLAPIAECTMSLHHLVQRILCLQASCTIALKFDLHIWLFPDEASAAGFAYAGVLHQLEKVGERMQRMLSELKMRDLNIDGPPIPLHILETTETLAALFNLEPPPGRSADDMLVRFCRGVQDSILRNFYAEQRDAISAELMARRVSWDDKMRYVLGDNYKSQPGD